MFLNKIVEQTSKLSIRLRLTLLFVVIFGSTLIGFGYSTFLFISTELQKKFDGALYNYAVDIAESVTLNSTGDLSVVTPEMDRQKIYPFSLGTALIQIRTNKGTVVARVGDFGNLELPFKKDFTLLSQGEDTTYRTITKLEGLPSKESESYRIINFALDNSPIPQLILQVAVPMTFLDGQIRTRKLFLEITIPLIILVSTLIGYFLSYRALRPINQMVDTANEIGAHRLSERLPVPKAKDELYKLSQTLNQMLERLEKSFTNQERFVADASHQLLTPLTIMKGELEGAESLNKDSILQEVDHLIALVKNMLLLARTDAGLSALTLSQFYFEDLILEVISRSEKSARAKNIKINFNMNSNRSEDQDRPRVQGDEELLFNCLFNILENSIKYSPKGGRVDVTLLWKANSQLLTISDQGPGIPMAQKELIFQRFSRGNVSKSIPGYGLGLAIAKRIADLHDAKIWCEDNSLDKSVEFKGTKFLFEIKII